MIATGSFPVCAAAFGRRPRSCFFIRSLVFILSVLSGFIAGRFSSLAADTFIVNAGESINNKLKSLQPGDTLLVRAGTYNESLSLPLDGLPNQRLVLRAFANDKPIISNAQTLLSWNKSWWLIQGLTFDQQGAAVDAIKLTGSNNILRGCELRNGKKDGIDGGGSSRNNVIENCVIHHFVNQPGVDAHGIVINPGATGWKIRNNKIYDCGGDCIQFYADDKISVAQYARNFTIAGNVFYTTLGSNSENALDFKGIDSCVVDGNEMYGFANKIWVIQKGCRNITAANNRMHDADRGFEARGEGGKSQENIKLVRNVIYNIKDYGIKFDGVANVQALNNTLANVATRSFRVEGAGVSSGAFRNNLIYNSGPASVSGTFNAQADHNGWFNSNAEDMSGPGDVTGGDPKFVNAVQFNFNLQAGSPAKDAGVNVGMPYFGAHPDLGAYEIGMTTPVKLNHFSVEQFGASVLLRWQTGEAKDFWGFEIERSANRIDFAKVAFITAQIATSEQAGYEYLDRESSNGRAWYRLKMIDHNGQFSYSSIVEVALAAPFSFNLAQNYPNPFFLSSHAQIASTRIAFDLSETSEVTVAIYNMLGQIVRTLQNTGLPAGRQVVAWDGRDQTGARVAAGFYIYRLTVLKSGRAIWTASKQMSLIP